METSPRRPFGASLMSAVLGWLAVIGLLNAFAWQITAPAFDPSLPPQLSVFIYVAQSWHFTVLALSYGATAVAASIGIWRMRTWMAQAFLAWSGATVTLVIWFALVFRMELPAHSQTLSWLWLAGTAAVLAMLYFYVSSIAIEARRAPH